MNKLSVVMSFLNEKEEVRQTVSSIRNTVGNRVDIVVVNDASDLYYNYEKDLEGFNVRYYTNKNRVGAMF